MGERKPRPVCLDAPRLEDGLRDGWAADRVPGDRERSGMDASLGSSSGRRSGWQSALRNVGATARRVRTLPAVTLSETAGQGERTRSRRYGR